MNQKTLALVEAVEQLLKQGSYPKSRTKNAIRKAVAELREQSERDKGIVELARDTLQKDGEIEIDDGALVSESERENGAYVEAWVWLYLDGTAYCKGPCETVGCPQCSK